MTEGERFFRSIELFASGRYTLEFGRGITVGCTGTTDMEKRKEILQEALDGDLTIDDYIALKKIWIDE